MTTNLIISLPIINSLVSDATTFILILMTMMAISHLKQYLSNVK